MVALLPVVTLAQSLAALCPCLTVASVASLSIGCCHWLQFALSLYTGVGWIRCDDDITDLHGREFGFWAGYS